MPEFRATHNSKLLLHGKKGNLWLHSLEFILISVELCPMIHVAPVKMNLDWLLITWETVHIESHREIIWQVYEREERKDGPWNEYNKPSEWGNIRTRETLCKYTNKKLFCTSNPVQWWHYYNPVLGRRPSGMLCSCVFCTPYPLVQINFSGSLGDIKSWLIQFSAILLGSFRTICLVNPFHPFISSYFSIWGIPVETLHKTPLL